MPDFHQDHGEQSSPSARDYRLSPRKVAMWCAVAAVAAVVALIAVAVITEADALNTVALYLAVIAFVAQLIMYVAQNESAARQLKQSQDVQRQTSMMLSSIQAQAANMQQLLNEQYDKVITALVERAAAVGEGAIAEIEGAEPDTNSETAAVADREALRATLREDLRVDLEQTAQEAARAVYEEQALKYLPAATTGPTFAGASAFSGPVATSVPYIPPSRRARSRVTLPSSHSLSSSQAQAVEAALRYLDENRGATQMAADAAKAADVMRDAAQVAADVAKASKFVGGATAGAKPSRDETTEPPNDSAAPEA